MTSGFRTLLAENFHWRHHDIFQHRNVRKQIETLEDKADSRTQLVQPGARAMNIDAVKQDLSLFDGLKTVDRPD